MRNKMGRFVKGDYQGFGFKKNHIPWNKGIPCSIETKNKLSHGNKGKRRSIATEFKRAPIGTRWVSKKTGKIRVKVKHTNKWQLEHTYIAEKVYRKLKKGECVHHIDLNHLNNDPKNLYICNRSKHKKMHSFEPLIRELMKKEIIKFNRKKGEYYVL